MALLKWIVSLAERVNSRRVVQELSDMRAWDVRDKRLSVVEGSKFPSWVMVIPKELSGTTGNDKRCHRLPLDEGELVRVQLSEARRDPEVCLWSVLAATEASG